MLGGSQQDVGGLKITMDDAIGVRCLDGPRQHFDKLCRQTRRLWRALEVLGQVAAGDVLQDKIRAARDFADIVRSERYWDAAIVR